MVDVVVVDVVVAGVVVDVVVVVVDVVVVRADKAAAYVRWLPVPGVTEGNPARLSPDDVPKTCLKLLHVCLYCYTC